MQLPSDPILRELVPEFIASWRADVRTLLPQLSATHNSQELYRFGHTLKGSARQFGFEELADCGAEIMQIAREQQWETLAHVTERIVQSLAEIEQLALAHNLPIPNTGATNM
jgi:HPt (histidine-containing phosphotransfer) domain-containing protein